MKQIFKTFGLSLTLLFLTVAYCLAQESKQSKSESSQTEIENTGFQCSEEKPVREFEFIIKVGDITKKAAKLPKPKLSSEAKKANLSGEVVTEVLIFAQTGEIVWARVKSGQPLLQKAVEKVVCKARFYPAFIEGKAIGTRGTITYKF